MRSSSIALAACTLTMAAVTDMPWGLRVFLVVFAIKSVIHSLAQGHRDTKYPKRFFQRNRNAG